MTPAFMNLAINGIEKLFVSKWIEEFFIDYKEQGKSNRYEEYDNSLTKSVMRFQHEMEALIAESNMSAIDAYFKKLKYEVAGLTKIDKKYIRTVAENHNADFEKRQMQPIEDFSGIRFWEHNMANEIISMDYFDEYHAYVMKHVENFIGTAEHFIDLYDAGEIKPNILDFLSAPEIWVEGIYDVQYITKYLELTGHEGLLEKISLIDGKGKSNLTRIVSFYRDHKKEISHSKKLILFDCDVGNANDETINAFIEVKRVPNIAGNKIQIGIENLFPDSTIDEFRKQVSDLTVKGVREGKPMLLINKDRKKALCKWICENDSGHDFQHFNYFLKTIASFIKS